MEGNMYSIKNFEENDDVRVLGNLGAFTMKEI